MQTRQYQQRTPATSSKHGGGTKTSPCTTAVPHSLRTAGNVQASGGAHGGSYVTHKQAANYEMHRPLRSQDSARPCSNLDNSGVRMAFSFITSRNNPRPQGRPAVLPGCKIKAAKTTDCRTRQVGDVCVRVTASDGLDYCCKCTQCTAVVG